MSVSPHERGLTIEGRGRRSAAAIQERMLSGKERGIRIIKREIEPILSLLALSGHPHPRASEVRLDELGRIYTSRWQSKEIFSIEGRLTIENPQNYTHLRAWKEWRVDLADLPQVATTFRPVIELIWGRIDDDIESAIRQQSYILQDYRVGTEAPELVQVKTAIAFIQQQSLRFVAGGLTKDGLKILFTETTNFLDKSGLLSSEVCQTEKEKIREMLLRSCQPDKLDRVNPLVSRTRLQSAYLAGIKRAVAISMITKKAEDNLRLLSWERETTRWALEMAADNLAIFAGIGKRGHVAFWKEGERVSDLQISAMTRVLENIAGKEGLLSIPRVVDYLGPVRMAALNLLGSDAVEDVDLTARIIGKELTGDYLEYPSVPTLLRKRAFSAARRRMTHSYRFINLSLNDHAFLEKAS